MNIQEKRKSLSFIEKVSSKLVEEAPVGLLIEDIRVISNICAEAIERMEQYSDESDVDAAADVAISEIRDIMHSVDDEKIGFGEYSMSYSSSILSIRKELEKIPEPWEVITKKVKRSKAPERY